MDIRAHLLAGQCIPAHPLALTARRTLDERYQRALTRYYVASGAGGLAVAVHSTQFAIRDPEVDLLRPVLELASATIDEELRKSPRPFVKVAGVCGTVSQAVGEARLARELGYDAVLVSLGAYRNAEDADLISHCREVAMEIPVVGFYLQPAVGGRTLSQAFWRSFAEIENVVAIKISPFNRYQTLDVVRAVAEAGRSDIALYTGNDDNIVVDLLTPFSISVDGAAIQRRIVGGMLGHWAVWTRRAVEMLDDVKRDEPMMASAWLTRAAQVTESNAAIFDAANGFQGCIPGIHEVLRRQGLMEGTWCLDPNEGLSPGQADEITRVHDAYPELNDDDFVRLHRDEWLS